MPLKILRTKNWNVWNNDNREKVLRDERVAKEEEESKADIARRSEFEKKIELLKAKAKKTPVERIGLPPTNSIDTIPQEQPLRIKNEENAPSNTAKNIKIKSEYNSETPPREDSSKVSTPPLLPLALANTNQIPDINLDDNGHINLFQTEDQFLMLLGKTNNKKEGPENRFKRPELPGNKDYLEELHKEEMNNLKREGIAPLGLGTFNTTNTDQRWYNNNNSNSNSKDENNPSLAVGRNGKILTGDRAERWNKREDKRKEYYDPINSIKQNLMNKKVEVYSKSESISDSLQMKHVDSQVDDIVVPLEVKRKRKLREEEDDEDDSNSSESESDKNEDKNDKKHHHHRHHHHHHKHKHKHHKSEENKKESMIDQLRRERLERERKERVKMVKLLAGTMH